MEKNQDIRWKQRFASFHKAVTQLDDFISKAELNKFERQGLVQCFEYTFELAWKTLKDYLQEEGLAPKTPRETIQVAFQAELLADGHIWIDALQKRNLLAHTYDESNVEEAESLIRSSYHPAIKQLHSMLRDKL